MDETQAITLLDTIPGVDQRGAERWVSETVLTQLAHSAARTKGTYLSDPLSPPGDTSWTQESDRRRGACAGRHCLSYVDAARTLSRLERHLF
jgi:hypothetical protein